MSSNMFESVSNSCGALLPTCLITGTIVILTLIIFRSFSKKQVNGLGEKYVLITGCDSGFGHDTAIQLDKMGVYVLATCLTKEGEQSLKVAASERLKTFQMDVTNSQQIKNLYTQVKEALPSGIGTFGIALNVGPHRVIAHAEQPRRLLLDYCLDALLKKPLKIHFLLPCGQFFFT